MALRLLHSSLVLLAVCTLAPCGSAQLPSQTLPITGELTDAMGSPQTGTADLTFRIYDVAMGGVPLWQEAHAAVPLSAAGRYELLLGSISPLTSTIFDSADRWLSIEANGDGEMDPRLVLGSYPTTHNSALLDGLPSTAYALQVDLSDQNPVTAPVHWDDLVAVPMDILDGDADTLYAAGSGLNLITGTFSVVFGSSGALAEAARSDHDHTGTYVDAASLASSDGSPPNVGANLVHWDILNGVPGDLLDGDDDTIYAPGPGLFLVGQAFWVDFAGPGVLGTVSRSDHTHAGGPGGGLTLDDAYDFGGPGAGRAITADSGAVEIASMTAMGTGLDVDAGGGSAIAIRADLSGTGVAIRAASTDPTNTFSSVQAETASTSMMAAAVVGNTTGAAHGVAGQVMAGATAQQGVYGSNLRTNGGHGVRGVGFNGVVGETSYSMGNAVWGENFDAIAPIGNGVGVAGKGFYGVLGEDRYLGGVAGAFGVFANGNLGASGTKSFRIDHPLEPADRFLVHFSVESPEVLNLYRGNAVCGENGKATVQLPAYFASINRSFSYHLTPIGAPADLFVAAEVEENGQFVIGGGAEGLKVSWTVVAERNDAYLQAHPEQRAVEPAKSERERGRLQRPALHGQPAEKALFKSPPETGSEQLRLSRH